ncbi:MAG: oligosaccharide flippase family protein [Myxococcota bacterium]
MSASNPTEPDATQGGTAMSGVVARGALVNVLGGVGKLLLPASLVIITRLFGPDIVGLFVLGFIMIDVATNLTVSGINDGVLMLASREDVAKDDARVHRVVANGFVLSLAAASVILIAAWVGGPALIRLAMVDAERLEDAERVAPLVQVMVLSVPFRVVSTVVIAATKVKMTMKWDALLAGFCRSATFLVAAIIAYFVDGTAVSLAWAYVAGWVAVGVASMFVFRLYYRYAALFAELARLKISWELVRFAIPQNLNMAFGRFATDIDAVMLAYFSVPTEDLAFYWMGGQIVRNVRQIKLIFSGAYAPVIARMHAMGEHIAMNQSFSMVSRWATTLALPAALVIVFFRSDLIWLFHETFTDDTRFMLLLLIIPLLSCSVGLASNVIVMTGHSGWNLFNSLTMAAINIALNYVLIPRFGILGAAAASVIASVVTSSMALLEARVIVGVSLQLGQVYKPFVAGLAGLAVSTAWLWMGPATTMLTNLTGCALALTSYVGVLFALGIPQNDLDTLLPWRTASRA